MIAVIELPTPRVLKRKLKKYLTKERIGMYILISGGIAVIYFNSVPFKVIPIAALLYCGIAYEVLEQSDFVIEDPRLIEIMLQNYSSAGYFLN
ncbi:MAG: hypothetical protein ACRCWM_02975 [Sarcina sp.]